MPAGVDVSISARSGPAGGPGAEDATYMVAGITELGFVDRAVVIGSLADYVAMFGQRVTYGALYDDLRTHFEEGGVRAVVSRVVGPGATVGTLILKDTNAGTAANTLQINAAWPGARSTGITVAVSAGSAAGLFTISVALDGVAKETFADLSSPADAANQLVNSGYVRGVDLGSATTAPNNNPAAVVATALSAGNDDRASVTSAYYVAGLARFGEVGFDRYGVQQILGAGAVAIPGQPLSAVGPGIAAHCVAHARVGLTSNPVGTPQTTAATNVATLRQTIGVNGGLQYMAAALFPGIRIPDGGNVVRLITAEGYAAAKRAIAITTEGPERSIIGKISEASFVLGPEVAATIPLLDRTASDAADAAFLIPVRSVAGTTRIYGYRSLSADPSNYHLLKDQDLLNSIQVAADRLAEDIIGGTIDGSGHLASKLQSAMVGLLDPIAKRGGLFPRNGDAGYSVNTSAIVNTLALTAQDIEAAILAVRISPTAEKIQLTIIKAALAANV